MTTGLSRQMSQGASNDINKQIKHNFHNVRKIIASVALIQHRHWTKHAITMVMNTYPDNDVICFCLPSSRIIAVNRNYIGKSWFTCLLVYLVSTNLRNWFVLQKYIFLLICWSGRIFRLQENCLSLSMLLLNAHRKVIELCYR